MKFQTKTIHSVDYNDLDEAINEFLKEKGATKTDFEIVAHHELMNDMSKEFSVGKYNWAVPKRTKSSLKIYLNILAKIQLRNIAKSYEDTYSSINNRRH